MALLEMFYSGPLILLTAVMLALALYFWLRRHEPYNAITILIVLAGAEWTITYAAELNSVDLATKIFWEKLKYVGIATLPTSWFVFALQYTGRKKSLTRRRGILLSLVPFSTAVLALTNENHHLIWESVTLASSGPLTLLSKTYGMGMWLFVVYSYVLVLSGVCFVFQMLLHTKRQYRWQAVGLLFAVLVVALSFAIELLKITPFPSFSLALCAYAAVVPVIVWSWYRLRRGDIVPAASHSVIESLSDGVLVLDSDSLIVYLNLTARRQIGQAVSKVIGKSIEQVWPEWSEQVGQLSEQKATISKEITLDREDNRTFYELRISALFDWRKKPLGHVVVIRDVTERKLLENELADRYEEAIHLADHDPVTGLLNHRAIHGRLNQELKRALRSGKQLSVAMMDLDGFKLFNDTYGHPVGDSVLREVAALFTEVARESDLLGRYGGDEFIAILPETVAEGALTFAERLRSTLTEHPFFVPDGLVVPLSMSFGIATYPQNGRQAPDLIGFADANLYESKQQGGNTITVGETPERADVAKVGSFGILDGLVTAVDRKDHYTRQHSEDVTQHALAIAHALGLSEESERTLRIAGLLHDVGKIGVPDRILRKPGRLDDEEFSVVKQHVLLGEMIVKEVPNLQDVLAAIGSHHERLDGKGYPRGRKGEEIPLLGRILAVADAYSAMTTDRPYRKAMSPEEAKEELLRVSGSQLDPNLVEKFIIQLDEEVRSIA